MSPLFHRRRMRRRPPSRPPRGAARGRAHRTHAPPPRSSRSNRDTSRSPPPSGWRGLPRPSRRLRSSQRAWRDGRSPATCRSSEWSALARLGMKPITQVMGSSIYQVGWQPTLLQRQPTEVRVAALDAYNEMPPARARAPARGGATCRRRRRRRRGDRAGRHDWAARRGRVHRARHRRAPARRRCASPQRQPVLTDLAGQEFAQLCAAGIAPGRDRRAHERPLRSREPAQTGGCSAAAGRRWRSWANQELVDFTQGVYEAREKAMGYVSAQAAALGGDGVVGVEISQHSRTARGQTAAMYESRRPRASTFHVMGTVDPRGPRARLASRGQPPPLDSPLDLR